MFFGEAVLSLIEVDPPRYREFDGISPVWDAGIRQMRKTTQFTYVDFPKNMVVTYVGEFLMVQDGQSKKAVSSLPLDTRHVFLDTQVYRALGHNPANRALVLLSEQIEAHRVVLHCSDITLLEVERQIRESVLALHRTANAVEKDLSKWRKSIPSAAPTTRLEFDAGAVAHALFAQFVIFIKLTCNAVMHDALKVDPASVFQAYFGRKPPFDGEESKEFPDAFVIEALRRWADENDSRLHVVTEDKAMARAVALTPRLHGIKGFHEMLARAAADLGPLGEAAADRVLQAPAFDVSFEHALRAEIKDANFVYTGELPEGEAFEGDLLSIEAIDSWSIVGLSDDRIALIMDVKIQVRVEIQYENRDLASYDKEDDIWFNAAEASIDVDDTVDVEVLVEIKVLDGTVINARILSQEVRITGPSDWDY